MMPAKAIEFTAFEWAHRTFIPNYLPILI